jgi:hypothetical protein
MKTDKKYIDKIAKQENRKTDSHKLAIKLALALSGSQKLVSNEFSFFDAKGIPLHVSNAGKGLVLGY